jgi:hypothetical protein
MDWEKRDSDWRDGRNSQMQGCKITRQAHPPELVEEVMKTLQDKFFASSGYRLGSER